MKTCLTRFILACALLAGATAARAGMLANIEIVDRTTGRTLITYTHEGRFYVAGTPGDRYAVRLRNRTGGRLLTVVSVDGVNVLTGDTAAPDQTGYVLSPRERTDIAGWRKSETEVAAFYFTRLPDSYAARTERPGNVGVIGVAVFKEYVPPPPPVAVGSPRRMTPNAEVQEAPMADAANEMASAKRMEAKEAEKLGTGHGERLHDPVTYTDFRRQREQANEIIAIYYDSRANLIARGIIPNASSPARPQPFPGHFVPDPKG